VISSFTANPSSIKAGEKTKLQWGPVTNGNTSELVRSVEIYPEVGSVGSPGEAWVYPTATMVYALTATGCGGTVTEQVTVTVKGSGSSGSSGSSGGSFSADFAVTDLYITKNVNGTVYARVTNHGPGNAANINYNLVCSAIEHSYTPGAISIFVGPWTVPINGANLNPGQTKEYSVNYVIDTTQNWYEVECEVQVGWSDGNTSNNKHQEKFPPPP